MKKFILGFVMAIVSIVVGTLIFIGKIVHRGSKNMPWTTKRYIKDQFTFVDISKLKNAIANSIKAFVDWVFFAKETTCFNHRDSYYGNERESKWDMFDRSYHAQKHNDICKAIDKCMAKPYFIDVEEYGCGYSNDHYEFKPADSHESTTVFVDGMSKIIHGGIYMEHSFKRMDQLDWIAVMMSDMLGKDIDSEEDGKHYYIHDPRDGTDYDIRVTINYKDERRYFIEEKEFGGDGIYKKEYYNYLWDKRKLMWLPVDIEGGPKQIEVSCPEWLINMLWGHLSGETFYIRDQVEDKDYCIYTKFSFEPDSDDVKGEE